ncbi:hypothetical protein M2158_003017 [Streptomyces sp. SAI-144]|uniref:DinB family protein n=1 Tax=Streptomyces sp. SAI-144 TaxID=2940544 RepID=UPI0024733C45|nr:DinB family protein [Streptomyces sp. SAI-144]MDH6434540.1 hypothetical protein [Streptomyces sp. SAI-144]
MTATDAGTDLRLYLQDARDSLLLKLDGLSEYDVRRPLTPTGTNLLGLVKHLTGAEAIYFGETFGRPAPRRPAPVDHRRRRTERRPVGDPREQIVDGYRRACAHADETLDTLPLDTVGRVPWPPHSELTLQRILLGATARIRAPVQIRAT